MSAPMTPDVIAIEPHRTLVIDGAKPREDAILPFFLLGRARISDGSLVPDDLVDFLHIDARSWGLEDVRDLDASSVIPRHSFQMPVVIKTAVCIVEGEGPGPVERCP